MSNEGKTPVFKRVLAMIGLVVIVCAVLAFLLVAVFGDENSNGLFMGMLGLVVAVPILVWLLLWGVSVVTGRHNVASFDAGTSNKQHDKYGNVIPDGNINTVVFDIGNVLTDFAWEKFIMDKGYDEKMVERMGNATVRSDDWVQYDYGNLTNDQIIDLFVENDPEIADDIRKVFSDLKDIILKREKTIPWIKALKSAGYKVLYLSNFSSQALYGNPDAMAFIDETDGGILSYREQMVKPFPEIYNLLVERYKLTPSKTVFIDDTKVNIDACKELGWNGIVYTSYEQAKEELEKLGVKY